MPASLSWFHDDVHSCQSGESGPSSLRRGDPLRWSKFTPEQIAQGLRQAEAGTVVGDVCREACITEATFDRWKKTHVGLNFGALREHRQLREEHRRLKGMADDLTRNKTIPSTALGN